MINTLSSAIECCAITFIGNASNKQQQDALFFLNDWFQERLGITSIEAVQDKFCLAVSDGLGSSKMSQHCSKAIVSSIDKLWEQRQTLDVLSIHKLMIEFFNKKKNPSKYDGASATLALITGEKIVSKQGDNAYKIQITHVGDSRVYLLKAGANQWQCLTRDHNLLNDIIDEQAQADGRVADFESYNATGMASMLNTLTQYFVFNAQNNDAFDDIPNGSTQSLTVTSGDSMLICTDGIHDLVPSDEWHSIDKNTELKDWLRALKQQVYDSEGNAYDNGTAIIVRVG